MLIKCELCGNDHLVKDDGYYVCEECGKKGAQCLEELTTEHIPYRRIWSGEGKEPIRIDSKVPFEKYWPKPKEK